MTYSYLLGMNYIIESILSLNRYQLDTLVQLGLIIGIVGIYITPSVILIQDIHKRYSDKLIRIILSILTIMSLPLFIIPYILFRKETTQKEDQTIESELDILTTSNNCIKCSVCKAINRADHNYCIICGTLIIASCRNCGQNIDLNWNHCGYCGNSLKPNQTANQIKTQEFVMLEEPKLETHTSEQHKNQKILNLLGNKINSLLSPTTEIYR